MDKKDHVWVNSFVCLFEKMRDWVEENASAGLSWCHDGEIYGESSINQSDNKP